MRNMSEKREEDRPNATGRTQLRGVLDDLVQQTRDQDEQIVVDDDVEEGARDLMELPSRGGGGEDSTHSARKRGKAGKSPVRRRRKRQRKENLPSPEDSDSGMEGERHIPHVMTLFDRKVDLARFNHSTPLYVMCREWMCNNPEKMVLTNGTANDTGNHIPEEELQTLPQPSPLSVDDSGTVIRLDIPKPFPPHGELVELDQHLETANCSDTEPDISFCREQHVKRWKEIRTRWKLASIANQQRYVESLRVVREMYQR